MAVRVEVEVLKSRFKEDKSKKTVYLRMDWMESIKVEANSKRA